MAGAGLKNLGNTCFANSALQCIFHTPILRSIIMEYGSMQQHCEFSTRIITFSIIIKFVNEIVENRSHKQIEVLPVEHFK